MRALLRARRASAARAAGPSAGVGCASRAAKCLGVYELRPWGAVMRWWHTAQPAPQDSDLLSSELPHRNWDSGQCSCRTKRQQVDVRSPASKQICRLAARPIVTSVPDAGQHKPRPVRASCRTGPSGVVLACTAAAAAVVGSKRKALAGSISPVCALCYQLRQAVCSTRAVCCSLPWHGVQEAASMRAVQRTPDC